MRLSKSLCRLCALIPVATVLSVLPALIHAQTTKRGVMAVKPIFRDPIHDGAADPSIIWNSARKEWWMFYTNRRADMASEGKDVSWVHGTRIGIAVSKDGARWKYKGVANISYGAEGYTQWAPEVIEAAGTYHMYLTIVPGSFSDWNHPREIVHLTSPDLERWTFQQKLRLSSEKVIDPAVFQLRTANGVSGTRTRLTEVIFTSLTARAGRIYRTGLRRALLSPTAQAKRQRSSGGTDSTGC